MDEQLYNVNPAVGVIDGDLCRGSSANLRTLLERLQPLLTDFQARRRKPSKAVKKRNRCFIAAARFSFGRGVVGTVILNGPWEDAKEYLLHCSEPLFRIVETYHDAIVHLVVEIALLLRSLKEIPAVLHEDVCEAFLRYGVRLRLHRRHRLKGDEVMSRDEAADIRNLPDGSMGGMQGQLGHGGATAMAFLDQFASSRQESVDTSSEGCYGPGHEGFGEGGLWQRTTSATTTSASSTTSRTRVMRHVLTWDRVLHRPFQLLSVAGGSRRRIAMYSTPFVSRGSWGAGWDCLCQLYHTHVLCHCCQGGHFHIRPRTLVVRFGAVAHHGH